MLENERIRRVNIEDEMKSAYIDYAMSVIVSRALPDVRDGLKPVHRRVLFGMRELGTYANKAHKKSARIVGEVLGKYHPHGDSSVYEAMVRMAQDWSLRYTLIDGQGNFGSIDGDSQAAMRYTEARLTKIAEEFLEDLDKDTVDFKLNFDDTLLEPTVLPSKLPNLLVNGASGIAVGMATNMAPHNISEVINACISYVKNPEISIEELITHVKAPDFPTGGIIYGYEGVKDAFLTGRGRIVLRSKTHIETKKNGSERIIVTEIPYQVNKSELIKKIADLINNKKISGISNINDESDRKGMRIVFDLKRDAISSVVLNKLFKYTYLQNSFNVNNIALVNGRPELLNLRRLIEEFILHRHEIVERRTKYKLKKVLERINILEGLLIALDNLDKIIELIRKSKTTEIAKNDLIENYNLSSIQAKSILELRLSKLTGLEMDKVKNEYQELKQQIIYFDEILSNKNLRIQIIEDELLEIKSKYKDKRKTEIVYSSQEFNPEDFYINEKVVITISHLGYIKRTPLSIFRTQGRGGKGSKGGGVGNNDFLEHLFIANMHNHMLFFTEKGRLFWLKVYEIPEGSKIARGRAIQNLLKIEKDEKVNVYIKIEKLDDEDFVKDHYIVFATKNGIIKKTSLENYAKPRKGGIKAITIREDDKLIKVKLTDGINNIVLGTKYGKAINFSEKDVRAVGRTSIGVRGIKLDYKDDQVIGMVCIRDNQDILVVSEKGYGKRTGFENYRTTSRGGKGVKTLQVTEKTGDLVGIIGVLNNDDLMIIKKSGVIIRLEVSKIRQIGRATQGVRLIKINEEDDIAAIAKVVNSEKIEEENVIDNKI